MSTEDLVNKLADSILNLQQQTIMLMGVVSSLQRRVNALEGFSEETPSSSDKN